VTDPILSLRDVRLSYRRGRHDVQVLQDISLDLAAGEVVAVRAQRAQGKTSLLRVVAGMERPDRGSVRFDGQEVWRMSDGHRARLLRGQIALVDSAAPPLDVPVLNGIALPLLDTHGRHEAYERASAALARVGASECSHQHWSELADWERALVALAHGIAGEPQLLLVDDLTATLDLGEGDDIIELLSALAAERGIAALICVDNSSQVNGVDRIAQLAGGTLDAPPPTEPEPGNIIDFPGERPQRASS
jgi:predicted ABC-type transport system involved in lysophospholipase L1 biosynthesis ATPase subunit